MNKGTVLKYIFGLFLLLCALTLVGCKHEHSSDGTWEFDDEYHYHVCDGCSEAFDKEAHKWDEGLEINKPTEYKEGLSLYTCTVCGYEKEMVVEKLEHIHSLLPEYESDIENHWKTCQKCFEKVGVENHAWDSGVKKTGSDDITMTTYTCTICGQQKVEVEGLEQHDNILDYASDVVASDTVDILPSMIGNKTYQWESSDDKLYCIDGLKAKTLMRYQTHKSQKVTVSVTEYSNGEAHTYSKEITIAPVKFREMTNPKAVYFSTGSLSSYRNYSERYKTEGTLFSQKFKDNMDMIYYAFALPYSDGSVSLGDTSLPEVMELKNHGIRVLMVIGGVSSDNLKALTVLSNKDDTRAKLVKSILDLVERYNFDGVDMDWEYPGTSGLDGYTTEVDKINLNKLMRDLRIGLDNMQEEGGSPYILSAAIPATSWGSARYQFRSTSTVGGLNDYCDYINMMSYDSNSESYCTHLAPVYQSAQSHDFKFGVVYGTNTFTGMGLAKSKIILGAACYGKAYKVNGTVSSSATYPALNNSGTLTAIDGLDGSFASGTVYYSAIVKLLSQGGWKKYIEMNNGKMVGAYLYNSSKNIYITYDSNDTVAAKCEYAKANGMGVMAWAYGEDGTDTIVNTICDNL